jgi:hypothetical protein
MVQSGFAKKSKETMKYPPKVHKEISQDSKSRLSKFKELIGKIWWVIPPVFVVLFIPLIRTVVEMSEMYPLSPYTPSFISVYVKNISMLPYYFSDFTIAIPTLLIIPFLGVGFYLSRKSSTAIRIVVPIITAIIGHFISLVLMSMMFAQ